ncbi:hypothetical protein BGZ81_011080, partial [Podila clonocystis]
QGFVQTSQPGGVGLEDTELNAAQLNKIGEYRAILASGQFSQQEYEALMMKLQQEVILLGNPGSSLGQDGGFDYGQPQQQHLQSKMVPGMYPQPQGYPESNNNTATATPLTLTNSQLLTGPSSSVSGTGFTPVDFTQFQQAPSIVSSSSHSASASTANTSITNASSLDTQNSQLLGNSSNTGMVYPTLRQPQLPNSLSGVDNQMFVGLEYTEHDIMVYESMLGQVGGFTADGGLLGLDPTSVDGLLGGSDVIVGGADSLMEYMNDPELMMKEQLFSQVASNSVFSGGSQQQQQSSSSSSSSSLPSQQTQRPQSVSYPRQTR